jgi:hypothetical protein
MGMMADIVLLIHFAFILFVVLGGLLAQVWPRLMWLHLPAAVWGAAIALGGFVCPLTPLEDRLRAAAGQPGVDGGFIDHYLTPLIYPAGLTRSGQLVLGAVVIAINAAVYGAMIKRRKEKTRLPSPGPDRSEKPPAATENNRMPSDKRWRPIGCYCGVAAFEEDPEIPPGYCGLCDACGKPGHTLHFPGAVPFTGSWCRYHYYRAMVCHPLGSIGAFVWALAILAAAAAVFF